MFTFSYYCYCLIFQKRKIMHEKSWKCYRFPKIWATYSKTDQNHPKMSSEEVDSKKKIYRLMTKRIIPRGFVQNMRKSRNLLKTNRQVPKAKKYPKVVPRRRQHASILFCDYWGNSNNICANFDDKISSGSQEIHNFTSKWAQKPPNLATSRVGHTVVFFLV